MSAKKPSDAGESTSEVPSSPLSPPQTSELGNRGNLAVRGWRALSGWWGGIASWFSFVHHRRPDRRFNVFPQSMQIAEALAIYASVVLLLVLFADAPYLAAVREPGWQPYEFFEFVTEAGQADWFLYPAGILLILYSVLTGGGPVNRFSHAWHSLMLAAYFLFTSIAFSGLLAMSFKNLIGRARPLFVENGIWQSFPFRDSYEFASFPSGHATTAGSAAVAFALMFPRLRVFFLLAGLWVAVSRPALGVHFPSDVLAGFGFGAAFTWVYGRSFARKRLLLAFDASGKLVPRRLRLARLADRRSRAG